MLDQKNSKMVNYTDRPEDALTRSIIAGAIEVHRRLGPGLLESTYESCLIFELQQMGLKVESQKPLPIIYKNIQLECGYRLDILVNGNVIVEAKAIDSILPIHHAQLLTYLRISNCKVGLLINFNAQIMKEGIRRLIA
jgi:GxxExxY protein